jgi:ankyrin repeat protein
MKLEDIFFHDCKVVRVVEVPGDTPKELWVHPRGGHMGRDAKVARPGHLQARDDALASPRARRRTVRRILWGLGVLLAAGSALAAQLSPGEARSELARQNIPYTQERFEQYCSRGEARVVELFLAAGMSPNVRESGSQWPILMRAAFNNRVEVVGLLLKAGADADTRGPFGTTTLMYATHSPGSVQLLLDAGAKPNARDNDRATALMYAARGGRTEAVKLLLQRGADVSAKGSLEKYSDSTALHYAAGRGQAETIKELLRRGADVNARNQDGMTPLIWGAYSGDAASVAALLEAGASWKIASADGNTTVWDRAIFSQGKGIEVVRLLIARGVDIELRNSDLRTPLNYAVLKGDLEIVKLLVASGANANARDKIGVSTLALAQSCISQPQEVCKQIADVLIKAGATR